jgi:hypothetical protein
VNGTDCSGDFCATVAKSSKSALFNSLRLGLLARGPSPFWGIEQVGSFHCRFAKFLQEVQSGASRLNTEGIDERLRV